MLTNLVRGHHYGHPTLFTFYTEQAALAEAAIDRILYDGCIPNVCRYCLGASWIEEYEMIES